MLCRFRISVIRDAPVCFAVLCCGGFASCSAPFALAQTVQRDASPVSNGAGAVDGFAAPLPSRPVPSGRLVSTIASEGVSLFHEIEADVALLARRADFYALIGVLVLAPRFLEKESTSLNGRLIRSEDADRLLGMGDTLGNSAVPIGLSLALYASGKSARSGDLVRFGSDLLRAQVISGALTGALKLGTDRTRPDGANYAFPSGHTSSAFAAAGVIAKHYGWKWGVVAEATAVYVAVSRLQENRHFVSDVIGGALLGSYVAYRVTERSEKEPIRSVTPILGVRTYGLAFSARF